jgi:hypothetical protein
MISYSPSVTKIFSVYFRTATAPADWQSTYGVLLNAGYGIHRLLNQLFRSPTLEREVLPIARLYQVVFGRKPDPSGFDFGVQKLREGGDANGYTTTNLGNFVQNYWATSQEYLNRYPSTMSNTFFISKLYSDCLGRIVTADENTFWQNALDSGMYRRADVLAFVSDSPEFRARISEPLQAMMLAAFNDNPNAYTGGLL